MGREWLKTVLLLILILVTTRLIFQLQTTSTHNSVCDCSERNEVTTPSPVRHGAKLLSYQPPGNGWNNQRIALENALVLAKLLNRTLLVQPLAPHQLGNKLKGGRIHGYLAYNLLNRSDLLPPSRFLDLKLMSQVVPVQEIIVSHPQFVTDYSHMIWRNICHTPGYGFWVDQYPVTASEVDLLTRQKFSSLGRVWREKCVLEKERADDTSKPIIRYVSDLQDDPADILYFEHGTLFGVHIRFTTIEHALEAQKWVVDHVHYSQQVWDLVTKARQALGPHYNAIQVRRKDHRDRNLPPSYWIAKMRENNFSKEIPVYVATNDATEEWYQPFISEGFTLQFSKDLGEYLSFPFIKETLRNDLLGIHEQCLCEDADHFIGSPASTFNAFILRQRREVHRIGSLMMDTIHTYWIGHQI